ncbi:hypothetical protein HDV00_001062 [Rhizophlyctis rosea]|nr:hypothetical protein HDV00_001062 [Rhizophlyctis rosea]
MTSLRRVSHLVARPLTAQFRAGNFHSYPHLALNCQRGQHFYPAVISNRSYSRLSSDKSSRRAVPRPRAKAPVTPPLDPSTSEVPTPTIEIAVPVYLPTHDAPDAVITSDSGAYSVLGHPALMVTRQLEMMNVLIGYEQANKYAIKDALGNDVGFIAEEETAFSGILMRQFLRTRRPFKASILDRQGNVVLKIERPIKWLLNSQIFVYDAQDNRIGEVQQVWHLWRRKYDLFLKKRQFSFIDGEFWAWDFHIKDENTNQIGAINRNFVGFAREEVKLRIKAKAEAGSFPAVIRLVWVRQRVEWVGCLYQLLYLEWEDSAEAVEVVEPEGWMPERVRECHHHHRQWSKEERDGRGRRMRIPIKTRGAMSFCQMTMPGQEAVMVAGGEMDGEIFECISYGNVDMM